MADKLSDTHLPQHALALRFRAESGVANGVYGAEAVFNRFEYHTDSFGIGWEASIGGFGKADRFDEGTTMRDVSTSGMATRVGPSMTYIPVQPFVLRAALPVGYRYARSDSSRDAAPLGSQSVHALEFSPVLSVAWQVPASRSNEYVGPTFELFGGPHITLAQGGSLAINTVGLSLGIGIGGAF